MRPNGPCQCACFLKIGCSFRDVHPGEWRRLNRTVNVHGTCFCGALCDALSCSGLLHVSNEHGPSGSRNRCFFSSDVLKGVSQHLGVLEAQGGDERHISRSHACGVKSPTKTCFQHQHLNRFFRSHDHGDEKRRFEKREGESGALNHLVNLDQSPVKSFTGHRISVEPNALFHPHQMR